MVPETAIDNVQQAASFGEDRKSLIKKIGALRLPVLDPSLEPSDMATIAVKKVCKKSGIPTTAIQALIVVTQTGDGAQSIPHVSAKVHANLNLDSAAIAFDIGLGCSGYVFGLKIIQGLMEQLKLNYGVLVTADPYSRIIDRMDRTTTLLFGDASTATIIDRHGDWDIGHAILETDGTKFKSIQTINNLFEMNGRQVFNFAVNHVPKQINMLLKHCNLQPTDVNLYILHQGSAAIVNAIACKFPDIKERFPLNILKTGNTVSSSIPLILEAELSSKGIDRIILSGFGVGLSWGSSVLTRVNNG